MTEQKPISISLTDQIMDTLFSSLENEEGFDNDLIEGLRNLVKDGDLTKTEKITSVLKKTQGGDFETH
ncbi:MAG: hypothetical protein GYA12_00515 [Chloroflexi bacterium]|nr:hypothetical protein [Chloroflexota bacterium]